MCPDAVDNHVDTDLEADKLRPAVCSSADSPVDM